MRVTACEPGRRILVVDDNPATLYATSRVLRAAGFEVVEATTGQEGLDRVAGVDLVVLDVNLPDIDGFEICRRIRANPATTLVPVVHLSASYIDEEDRESGYDAGADGYLTHPVEPVVLIGTINSFLRTRRAEAARRAFEQERERLLASERAAREEAERANAMKDEFLAMLSHELRNPLNAVVGWAQVLRSRYDDAALHKGLNIILNAAQAQAQLISDLLDISRITTGKMSMELRPVALASVVASALETIEASARSKGIRTRFPAPDEAVVVMADPLRLQQVVWNLLHNAVKFTPPRGQIEVAIVQEGGQVQVSVRDSGAGMDPDLLPHVFERFRQADSSMRKQHGGLGLGLTIVRLVAEAHNGHVDAVSEGEGMGSTFTVTLPLADPASLREPTGPDTTARRKVDFGGVRVLVVEDDPASRELVAALFGDRGAIVESAASVEEALERLPLFEPELLVSDVAMPVRDGFDLLRTVREMGYDAGRLPAIALTAFAGSSDRDAATEAGFQRHLAKPIRADQLFTVASELLNRDLPK